MISKALSDIDLLQQLKGGDDKALGEIINRYGAKMLTIAKHRLESMEDAEECVQDVMVKLWNVREKLELQYTLNTYLSAAVKNKVYDILDKRHRERNKIQMYAVPFCEADSFSSEAEMIYKEMLHTVEKTVCELPEACKIIYRKRNSEGKTTEEIANELELSPKTVNRQLSIAKKKILDSLSVASYPVAFIYFFINELNNGA